MKRATTVSFILLGIIFLLNSCAERKNAVLSGGSESILVYLSSTPVRGVAKDVSMVGNLAYVADEPFGISVYDISDPANPARVDSLEFDVLFPDDIDMITIDPSGKIAIVVEPPGMSAYSLESGQALFQFGGALHYKIVTDFTEGVTPAQDELTVLRCDQSPDDGFNFERWADPFNFPSKSFFSRYVEPQDFKLYGFAGSDNDVVFICRDMGGIVAVDCSVPTTAGVISELNTPGKVRDAALVGDVLCLAAGYEGIITVDVSDPANMSILGSLQLGSSTDIERIEMLGNYALLQDKYDGIFAVNVSDPENPVSAGSLVTSDPNNFRVWSDMVIVADEDQGLVVGQSMAVIAIQIPVPFPPFPPNVPE
ncbi:hypothetical protein CEE37_03665 [candidate division LCP-89 bacterium B3_LCP]|uniref:Uncharacterized protein n=1 Tax=candidate division LCP-89 bacterium B3_LCP TaxID=2012998 RepID=A0A532V383_UNCL8|nr:MAG: hypothetical protein CEE37_03665 [candidate division LCP-89 bacterium B3_LCP]